jgi:RNA recognition motif-containing protein
MKKGRGHDDDDSGNDKYDGRGGTYERRDDRSDRSESGPIRSAGGWILFVRNLHDETDEDTLIDAFSEYGDVSNIAINRDKSDGKSLRYVLIEYEKKEEAIDAIKNMNGKELLERVISVDWAFKTSNSRR